MLQMKHQITAFMHVMNISKFYGTKIWSKGVPVHVTKAYGGMEAELCPFLASALERGEQSASHLGHFTRPHSRSVHFREENSFLPLPGIDPQFLGHATNSAITTVIRLFQLLILLC